VRKVRFFMIANLSSQHVILPRRLPLRFRLVSARLLARPCSDCVCRIVCACIRERACSQLCVRAHSSQNALVFVCVCTHISLHTLHNTAPSLSVIGMKRLVSASEVRVLESPSVS